MQVINAESHYTMIEYGKLFKYQIFGLYGVGAISIIAMFRPLV